jgi:hypothetical protein
MEKAKGKPYMDLYPDFVDKAKQTEIGRNSNSLRGVRLMFEQIDQKTLLPILSPSAEFN